MTKTWTLLKVQLFNLLNFNKRLHSADNQLLNSGLLVGFCSVLFAGISFLYSFLIAEALGQMDAMALLPTMMMIATSLITLITTIYKVNGTLFAFRDFDMVMSLPVKTSQVVASRIGLIYSMNLLFSFIIMIPAGVVFAIKTSPQWHFYPLYLLMTLLVPLFPIILGTLIGSLVTAISSRFKRANMVNMVLYFLALIGVMAASLTLSISQPDFSQLGSSLLETSNRFYPLAGMFMKVVADGNLLSFLLFLGISLGAFLLFAYGISHWYKKINSLLTAGRTVANFHMKELRQSPPLKALFSKEWKRYLSSPLYVMNTAFGIILMTLGALALLIFAPSVAELGKLLEFPGLDQMITSVAPLVFLFFIGISSTTTSSISLEGKNLWILKSSPVSVRDIFKSKLLVNLVITVPLTVLDGILLSIYLRLTLLDSILIILLPVLYAVFITVAGLLINLKLPNLTWSSEVSVIKQSSAVFVAMLVGFASMAVIGFGIFLLPFGVQINLALMGAFVAAAALGLYRYISTKGVTLFEKLS